MCRDDAYVLDMLVDAQEVWKIVTTNLPPLISFLESIAPREGQP